MEVLVQEKDPAGGDARDNGGADVHKEEPAHEAARSAGVTEVERIGAEPAHDEEA